MVLGVAYAMRRARVQALPQRGSSSEAHEPTPPR
jgi:hypothetical protein